MGSGGGRGSAARCRVNAVNDTSCKCCGSQQQQQQQQQHGQDNREPG